MKLRICIGTSCYLKGAYNVLQLFQHEIERRGLHEKIEISGAFYMGNCENGVSVSIDGKSYGVAPEEAAKFFEETIMPTII